MKIKAGLALVQRLLYAFEPTTKSAIRMVASPLVYLWPWVVADVAFAMLTGSDQGLALAEELRSRGPSPLYGVAILAMAWIIAVSGALISLVAAAATRTAPQTPGRSGRRRVLVDGLWIAVVSSWGTIVLAYASAIGWIWGALVGQLSIALAITITSSKPAAAPNGFLTRLRDHRIRCALGAVLLAILPLAIGGLVCITSPTTLAGTGPLLVALLGLNCCATLFGTAFVALPLALNRRWIAFVLAFAVVGQTFVASVRREGENPLLKSRASVADANQGGSCKKTPEHLGQALESHVLSYQQGASRRETEGSGSREPIYLTSAEGGGIRAALWTALNLAELDDATGGRFGEDVATLSGVSGGSLGLMTWIAARERVRLNTSQRLELVTKFLSSDFLSPIIGGFLFLDLPRALLGPLWFRSSRDQVFELALADRWRGLSGDDFFARPLLRLCLTGFLRPPAIFLNATDSITGQFVALSTAGLPTYKYGVSLLRNKLLDNSDVGEASVAQMVNISASFPYLSPQTEIHSTLNIDTVPDVRELSSVTEASMDARRTELRRRSLLPRRWTLVDGGYYDNTGMKPTLDALDHLQAFRAFESAEGRGKRPYMDADIRVLHISNDPGQPCFPLTHAELRSLDKRTRDYLSVSGVSNTCSQDVVDLERSLLPDGMSWLLSPVRAVLATRSAHSQQTLDRFRYPGPSPLGTYVYHEISLGRVLTDTYGAPAGSSFRRLPGDATRPFTLARQPDATVSVDEPVCLKTLKRLSPPLGWTLSSEDTRFLKCFALVVNNRQGFTWAVVPNPAKAESR